jgi:uncharacterized repeat protein (TIGR01451 family)
MRDSTSAGRLAAVAGVLLLVVLGTASCKTTPLDNIWPGCCPPAPAPACPPPVAVAAVCAPAARVPTSVVIDERVSPAVDCNPIRTQHTLVVTVLDQCGNPMPGQRVEWILSRYPEAVGDIVAVDDQYGVGAIAPLTNDVVKMSNGGNKIDNHYAVSITNYGAEMLDAGNNYPYMGQDGARLPDVTVGHGQSWIVITSTREGVTDLVVYVPAIRDGTKHKTWAKKIWADFDVRFPGDAVNVLPNEVHGFPVTIVRSDGSGIPGQSVEAEILDGPDAVFEGSSARTQTLMSDANGGAEFRLRNASGQAGTNRIRLTANGNFYGETCPRSKIVKKTWQQVLLEVSCAMPAQAVVGQPIEKVITVTSRGDAPATNVVLEDRPQGGLNIADGTTFPMQLGTLEPGQTVTKTVRYSANAEGTYTNTVTVRSDNGNATATNQCAIEIVQGRLELTKVCEPTEVSVGGNVTFVVTVKNVGRGPLSNVVVVDAYPPGITPGSQDTAQIGTLAPGDSRNITFSGTATETGTHVNTARATADGVPEATATCSVHVVSCRLEMELTGPEKILFGDPASFTVKVTNVGDGPAQACVVRVTMGGCMGGQVQDFQVGPLQPGGVWTQDFSASARSLGECVIQADSSCGQQCQIRREVGLKVTGLPALQLEMIDLALNGTPEGMFRVGETFIYRLRVENDRGTEVTPELVVAWRLPPELEFVSGRSNKGGVTVTGSGQACQSTAFSLGLDEAADFDVTVRVLSAPANGLVRTDAAVTAPALGGAELANESESTSLRP